MIMILALQVAVVEPRKIVSGIEEESVYDPSVYRMYEEYGRCDISLRMRVTQGSTGGDGKAG